MLLASSVGLLLFCSLCISGFQLFCSRRFRELPRLCSFSSLSNFHLPPSPTLFLSPFSSYLKSLQDAAEFKPPDTLYPLSIEANVSVFLLLFLLPLHPCLFSFLLDSRGYSQGVCHVRTTQNYRYAPWVKC